MKRQIIIGTAGHIDHGKTALIRALTGRETDRLKEEKQRGISIDLGFTHYDLASGERIGFIDVPGHERFVANMLSGAFGMDFVLFIIAADEGMMPQSREHLEILKLLHVQSGLVVVTKTDLVDPEWLEMVLESLDEELKDSFLENAPRICVSSKTGEGIEELRSAIEVMALEAKVREEGGLTRLWVDRSFSIKGFGSVVTGTLLGGTLTTGQEVMAYPQRTVSKIRRIQVHDRDVEHAVAGQRVAMNLPAFSKDEIERGDLIALPESLSLHDRIGVWVRAAKESPRPLHRGMELKMHVGSRKIPCKIEYMDPETLTAGEEGWMILRLGEEAPLVPFDRFVLRNLSPVETLAGGQVLDLEPPLGRRARRMLATILEPIYKGGPKFALLAHLNRPEDELPTLDSLSRILGRSRKEVANWVDELAKTKDVRVYGSFLLSSVSEKWIFLQFNRALEDFHAGNPLKRGMQKKQALDLLLPKGTMKQQMEVLEAWEAEGLGHSDGVVVWAKGFERTLTEVQKGLYETLMDRASIWREAMKKERWIEGLSDAEGVWKILMEEGHVIKVDGDLYAARSFFEGGISLIIEQFGENGFTVADFRDAYGVSRKQALLLLENYDQEKWTRRDGDRRFVREIPKFIG